MSAAVVRSPHSPLARWVSKIGVDAADLHVHVPGGQKLTAGGEFGECVVALVPGMISPKWRNLWQDAAGGDTNAVFDIVRRLQTVLSVLREGA